MIDRATVAEKLECYRMKSHPEECTDKDCPYNNNDSVIGCWCCSNSLLADAVELLQAPEIVRCKDCLYLEIKDFWGEFNGIPVLGASDQPTCTKWGDGDCKTSPDGYCFLAERR